MIGGVLRSLVGRLTSLRPAPAVGPSYLHTDDGAVFRVHAVKRGGMGIIYMCSFANDEAAEPKLALKTFDDRFFFDPQMQIAVETESQAWLTVSGVAYVLPLLGIVSCDGKPHLMMPAIAPTSAGDVSLADEIRRSPNGLPTERCFSVATRFAMALTECVRRVPDLVHGDIKPDNILLLGDGTPQLADFGAARLASSAGQAFAVQGTALYLAPECWDDRGRQTQAADAYAFGATLFKILSGMPPFRSASDSVADLERMHREQSAAFPSAASDGSLEQALRALVLDCLAKDPNARPGTAGAILKRLLHIGHEHDPASTFVDMMKLVEHRRVPEHPEIVASRVESLLKQGDGETALRILEHLPPEQIVGRLLQLHGTACSLAV